MRHGKKFNHLSRPASHRKALLMNQAKSLILHKRIITTVAKAKALRKFVEPIVTKAKQDSTHARRIVFSYFQDKEPVKLLFNEVAPKIGDRPGGYTRIIRMGNRLGDNSEMCLIELVDYNTFLQKEDSTKQTKVRTRRGKGKSKETTQTSTLVNTETEDSLKNNTNQPTQHLSDNVEEANSKKEDTNTAVSNDTSENPPHPEDNNQ